MYWFCKMITNFLTQRFSSNRKILSEASCESCVPFLLGPCPALSLSDTASVGYWELECLTIFLSSWQILQQWIGNNFCRCPANSYQSDTSYPYPILRHYQHVILPLSSRLQFYLWFALSTEKLCMAACHAFHACRIRSMCPSLWTGKPPSVKCWVLFSECLVGNPYCIRSTAAEACPLFA